VLNRQLAQLKRPYRLVVQYVPHAFGWKAMNVPLCLWLRRRRRAGFWVMFHEVFCPISRSQSWRHNLVGWTTRCMAAVIHRAAERTFVSIPTWGELLRTIAPGGPPATWLPVPSTLPTDPPAEQVAAVRQRLGLGSRAIVGHFGTFGRLVAPQVSAMLPLLLEADPNRVALLLGRDGDAFARKLEQQYPALRGRLLAPGALPAEELAAHLSVCDLLVQPYPDGASTRRTSLMAGLALGLPIVTTEGPLSEPLWKASRAVALAPATSPEDMAAVAEGLLADRDRRVQLGTRAKALYRERFALERLIRILRMTA
jgi:glycosyltransferase involved in cell wall biosynthesis